VVESTARAFAGTWRDEATGEIRGYSFGGTICWFPRKPWALKISRDGFDHVIRCGECPGCLEFDRRRLADRLVARYRDEPCELFIVELQVPPDSQSRVSHALHRRAGLGFEKGFFRIGLTKIAFISRMKISALALKTFSGTLACVRRVGRKSRRRSWRRLTAGLLVSRDAYGEQVKRWYARGLPPAEREEWEVERHAMQKPWRRGTGARARTGSELVLVPPEVWQVSRTLRRDFFRAYAKCDSPESSHALVANLVAAFGQGARLSKPKPPAEGRLSPEQVQAGFREIARRMNTRSQAPASADLIPPTSEVGGYVSSEHSGASPPGEKSAWESYQEEKGRALERQRLKDQELFQRFAKLGEKKR